MAREKRERQQAPLETVRRLVNRMIAVLFLSFMNAGKVTTYLRKKERRAER